MEPREHNAEHSSIDDLPLVTESATVTDVEPMDGNRSDEVSRAIDRLVEATIGADDDRFGAEEWDLEDRQQRRDLVDALVEAGHPNAARRVSTLAERHDRDRPMLVRVEITPDRRLQYLAGQYVGVRYGGNSRAYSLSSSPNSRAVELCVRRVPGGRLSPKLCGDLEVGDRVTLRGPHGHLVLRPPSERDLAFLATGTGVAPFKGMIDYLFEEGHDSFTGEDRDVWLFLGAAWEDDLPYHEEFEALTDEHGNFHYVPACSREGYLSDWNGETDYVQDVFLKYVDDAVVTSGVGKRVARGLEREPETGIDARMDPASLEVYACGINAMVHSLVQAVHAVGVPDPFVESEGFG